MDNWRRLGASALALPLVAVSVALSVQGTLGQSTSGNVYNVYPLGYTGPKVQPAFTGLLAAYYNCAANSDWNKSCPARVQPGDTILIHAGTYIDKPAQYSAAGLGTPFDGTYYLTAKGTATAPISIIAAGDGPVIFDGDSIPNIPRNHNIFNVMAADYNVFSGITVQNTDIAFLAGIKGIAGVTGLTIQNSTITNVAYGICDTATCLPSAGPYYGLTVTGFAFPSQ
jgi:hypothetical protein